MLPRLASPPAAGSVVADLNHAVHENLLGNVGMVLRDPPVLHLLLHETLRTLGAALHIRKEQERKGAKKIDPLAKDTRLEELTRLVALALAARRLLRERSPSFPAAPPGVMDKFFPLLGEIIASGGFIGDGKDDDGTALGGEKGEGGGTASDEEGEVPEDMEMVETEETNADGEIVMVKKLVPKQKPAFRIKINVKSAKKASVRQQIADLAAVDFEHGHFHNVRILRLALAQEPENLHRGPLGDAGRLHYLALWSDRVADAAAGARHRVGLARAGLAISKNACVHTIESSLNEWFDFFENISLSIFRRENPIKIENELAAIVFMTVKLESLMFRLFTTFLEQSLGKGYNTMIVITAKSGIELVNWLYSAEYSHVTL